MVSHVEYTSNYVEVSLLRSLKSLPLLIVLLERTIRAFACNDSRPSSWTSESDEKAC